MQAAADRGRHLQIPRDVPKHRLCSERSCLRKRRANTTSNRNEPLITQESTKEMLVATISVKMIADFTWCSFFALKTVIIVIWCVHFCGSNRDGHKIPFGVIFVRLQISILKPVIDATCRFFHHRTDDASTTIHHTHTHHTHHTHHTPQHNTLLFQLWLCP